VVFTVMVGASSGTAIPTGSVSLTDGGTVFATTPIGTNGTTVFTITTLTPGAHNIVASYPGVAGAFLASVSATDVINIPAPGLMLTPGVATLSFAPGATTGNSTTIAVAPSGGFAGSVALTAAVTTSPAGAVDMPVPSFGATSPVVISGAGSGSGTLTVATTAPVSGAAVVPGRPGVRYAPVALAGLLLLVLPRRRALRAGLRPRALLGLLLFFGVLGGAIGCGGHPSSSSNSTGSPGTTAGNYTITVTATSGSVTAQTTVGVTVQ
jgi:hypothetical protein